MLKALARYSRRKQIPLDDVLHACTDAVKEMDMMVEAANDLTPRRFMEICQFITKKYKDPMVSEFVKMALECSGSAFKEEDDG